MTTGNNGSSGKTQVTNEDLIEAVELQCKKANTPVVRTKDVAGSDGITVTQQTVKRRLDKLDDVNSLSVGRGKVWWVPEGEARGEVKMSDVYVRELNPEEIPQEHIERLDPDRIPEKLIEEHPSGPSTGWRALSEQGRSGYIMALIAVLSGTLLWLLEQAAFFPYQEEAALLGAIGVIGGLAVGFISVCLFMTSTILEQFDAPAPRLSSRVRGLVNRIRNWAAEKLQTG